LARGSDLHNDKILYTESVHVGSAVKSLLVMMFLLGLAMGAVVIASGAEYVFTLFYAVTYLITILFLGMVYVSFRVLYITIAGSYIDLRYGFSTHTAIPMNEVVGFERIKTSLSKYGGAGVRFGTDGSRAYVLYFGDAIRVSRKVGRAVVFSTRRASEVCDLLSNLTSQNSLT
jgi:hypothetical protein